MFVWRFIPWWLFALIAGVLAVQAYGMLSRSASANDLFEAAAALSAPEPVALADFDTAALQAPLDEFAVTSFDYAYVGPLGENKAVLFLHSDAQPGTYIAFTEYNPMGFTLEAVFETIQAEGSDVVLRGVLQRVGPPGGDLAEIIHDENLPPANRVFLADLLRGDRNTALEAYRQNQGFASKLVTGFALICALASFIKFIAWRLRRQTG